jgi:phosphohistidine phosphatase
MAKRLFLIRHGKANDGLSGSSDFKRTLATSGKADAIMMAERLRDNKFQPEHIVSSPASRALSTAKVFAEVWGLPTNKITTELFIYEADIESLLSVLNGIDNTYKSIAIFGHNPGITEFVNYLTDEGIVNLPTSGVIVIDFPYDDWAELNYQTGDVLLFDYPKSTKDGL